LTCKFKRVYRVGFKLFLRSNTCKCTVSNMVRVFC
jgi:hypothetical protein